MKIIFYGTPEFAVDSLKALVEANKNIVAVVTAPDRPAGRGYKLKASAVKEYALGHNLPVLQPTNLKADEFHTQLKKFDPDLQIIVAFRMLPEKVWNFPKLGSFNLHASLLPKYRGAAPINWAVINGEAKTGVSTFFLQHEIDTGEVINQAETKIGENETAGELHDRLMKIGSGLVVETVNEIEKGKTNGTSQAELIKSGIEPCPAPKLAKTTGKIQLHDSVKNIHNLIRGLSPFPGAFVKIERENQQKQLKIFRSKTPLQKQKSHTPLLSINDEQLIFSNKTGSLILTEVQLEGKKRMQAKDFIKGFSLSEWKLIDLN